MVKGQILRVALRRLGTGMEGGVGAKLRIDIYYYYYYYYYYYFIPLVVKIPGVKN